MIPSDILDWEDFLSTNGCDSVTDYGDWVMCNCLFHDQSDCSRPSLGINKESGVGNCLGCGPHSWEDICEVFGISAVTFIDAPSATVWDAFKNTLEPMLTKQTYLRYKLPRKLIPVWEHKGAKRYALEKQGYEEDVLRRYNISVCMDDKSKYYESIIFPILDNRGVLFFDARYVGTSEMRSRWMRPKDCAQWKTYFNWINVRNSKTLVFVEGAADALKLIQFGLPAIPAKNFSEHQYSMLLKSPCELILLAYDQDEAGRTLLSEKGRPIHFTAKAKNLFLGSGRDVRVLDFPRYAKDPAEIKTRKQLFKYNPILSKLF